MVHSLSTYAKFSEKLTYPLIRTCTCAFQEVRNISFSENFAYVINEWSYTKSEVKRSESPEKIASLVSQCLQIDGNNWSFNVPTQVCDF